MRHFPTPSLILLSLTPLSIDLIHSIKLRHTPVYKPHLCRVNQLARIIELGSRLAARADILWQHPLYLIYRSLIAVREPYALAEQPHKTPFEIIEVGAAENYRAIR